MDTQLEVQEKDFELVVSEKNLGSLTTNALSIKEKVLSLLPMYNISNYNEDNIDKAKADKALLNKTSKALNDSRIQIEKEFMMPFSEFKDVVTETVKLIGECSAKIDSVVKQSQQIFRDNKKVEIRDYFEQKNEYNIPFTKCFQENWLNKSFSIKVCFSEINRFFEKISSEISTIESMPEDVDALRTYYLDCLDLNNAIQYGNRLKEQRERAKVAEEARIKAEQSHKANEESRKSSEAEKPNTRPSNPFARANQQMNEQSPFTQEHKEEASAQPELLTRAFKVTTIRENIIALGDFMNNHGIDFEKIEI